MKHTSLFVVSSAMVLLIMLSLNYSQIIDSYTYGSALNKITVEPNFPLEEGTFEKIKNSNDSGCITTPNRNQYCYENPTIRRDDTVVSTMVGDNGITGEIHFDPVVSGVHYFTMDGITRIHDDTVRVFFADKDYRIGNKDRTIYEITEEFQYDSIVEKYDTFITHCANFDGTGATIVQYLGVISLNGTDYFVTWHTIGHSEAGIPCKYPELIRYSLSHNFGEF